MYERQVDNSKHIVAEVTKILDECNASLPEGVYALSFIIIDALAESGKSMPEIVAFFSDTVATYAESFQEHLEEQSAETVSQLLKKVRNVQ